MPQKRKIFVFKRSHRHYIVVNVIGQTLKATKVLGHHKITRAKAIKLLSTQYWKAV